MKNYFSNKKMNFHIVAKLKRALIIILRAQRVEAAKQHRVQTINQHIILQLILHNSINY